jgi:hypothetical protein
MNLYVKIVNKILGNWIQQHIKKLFLMVCHLSWGIGSNSEILNLGYIYREKSHEVF